MFSGVDIFNKHTFGPKSLQVPFVTKNWKLRFFFALFAMCETNAFLAHSWFQADSGSKQLTHTEHKLEMA